MSIYGSLTTIAIMDSMSNQFTKTDWKIAQYIKNKPEEFLSLPAVEIAKRLGTSDASIIRFAQKVGFNGLNELKIQYKRELEVDGSIKKDDNTLYSDYTQTIGRLFSLLTEEQLSLFAKEIKNAKRVYFCAFKQLSFLTDVFVERFLYIGINIIPITNSNTFRLYSANAQSGDLFIVSSLNSDGEQLLSEFNSLAKKEAHIIVISDEVDNKIDDLANLTLRLPKKSDLLSDYAISKSSLALILFDVLFDSVFNLDPENYSIELAKSIELTNLEGEYHSSILAKKLKSMFID